MTISSWGVQPQDPRIHVFVFSKSATNAFACLPILCNRRVCKQNDSSSRSIYQKNSHKAQIFDQKKWFQHLFTPRQQVNHAIATFRLMRMESFLIWFLYTMPIFTAKILFLPYLMWFDHTVIMMIMFSVFLFFLTISMSRSLRLHVWLVWPSLTDKWDGKNPSFLLPHLYAFLHTGHFCFASLYFPWFHIQFTDNKI